MHFNASIADTCHTSILGPYGNAWSIYHDVWRSRYNSRRCTLTLPLQTRVALPFWGRYGNAWSIHHDVWRSRYYSRGCTLTLPLQTRVALPFWGRYGNAWSIHHDVWRSRYYSRGCTLTLQWDLFFAAKLLFTCPQVELYRDMGGCAEWTSVKRESGPSVGILCMRTYTQDHSSNTYWTIEQPFWGCSRCCWTFSQSLGLTMKKLQVAAPLRHNSRWSQPSQLIQSEVKHPKFALIQLEVGHRPCFVQRNWTLWRLGGRSDCVQYTGCFPLFCKSQGRKQMQTWSFVFLFGWRRFKLRSVSGETDTTPCTWGLDISLV